ncbi:MAG: helicase [Caulobacterales bacterium 32-69-10]|nr:MAG: helicase [Caulobacterales bacterium 32-69-10]
MDVASDVSREAPPALDWRGPDALPPALAVLPGPKAALAGAGGTETLAPAAARSALKSRTILVAHAALTARRLDTPPVPRSSAVFDALELYAFVRPARFAAPTAAGLARAMGLTEPKGVAAQAQGLRSAAAALLEELAAAPTPSREEALAVAETLSRAGWAWGPLVCAALRSAPVKPNFRGSGLDVWTRLSEWEDAAPAGQPGSAPVTAEASQARLVELLGRAGLDEARPPQASFAGETAFSFSPRDREGAPRLMLAEAGTGVGKTLGYLAPASLWSELNGPAVWISTYTRALQRQIERESHAVYPDPVVRARKAVVRKGRENYLCLLNFQDVVQAAQLGNGDLIGAGLTARWLRASRDGDMTGGDFPAWLPTLFGVSPMAQASAANLVDRRGECVHAGCSHYRTCFIEKAIRASRKADIVIANHALVMTQAAFDGARTARGQKADGETAMLKRVVFDEGHHLFDAADAAFSACLSGQETAELRRWIRGPEGRRRGRGLEQRLADLVGEHETARQQLTNAIRAAAQLPGEGWSGRIAPPVDYDGTTPDPQPHGPIETFLAAALAQIAARADKNQEMGGECSVHPTVDRVREAAPAAAQALAAVEAPLVALARALEDLLDDEAAELPTAERARIEGALRGLDRRARMQLPAWRTMLQTIVGEEPVAAGSPHFVDWFEAVVAHRRIADAAFRRHWVDPTEPLAEVVLKPAHGVLVTSATLADSAHDSPFALTEMRTGAARLPEAPKLLRLASPFDYASNAKALVVTDVGKDDPRQVAAAMRELFLASGGGALGLFTAIRRLRTVYEKIAPALAEQGLALYAQHVDPLEAGALVDIFRAEEDSCLLGTDAIRDGVDVPGRALRLIVFDRIPWPRPDILHKARRERFGGRSYDDALARARIAQAFGRLIRRADDRGVFVMLDAAAPTRLFASLPEGIELQRVGLVEAIETVGEFLGK